MIKIIFLDVHVVRLIINRCLYIFALFTRQHVYWQHNLAWKWSVMKLELFLQYIHGLPWYTMLYKGFNMCLIVLIRYGIICGLIYIILLYNSHIQVVISGPEGTTLKKGNMTIVSTSAMPWILLRTIITKMYKLTLMRSSWRARKILAHHFSSK